MYSYYRHFVYKLKVLVLSKYVYTHENEAAVPELYAV